MNAQHAVRQGKLMADNIAATLRGREPKPYLHHSLGTPFQRTWVCLPNKLLTACPPAMRQ